MYVTRSTVIIETDESGDGTGYTAELNGLLADISYVKDDYADGVDFTITEEDTGRTIWTESDVNASATRSPRQLSHSTVGVSNAVHEAAIPIRGKIKIVIASGGDTKSGTFIVNVV